MSKFLCGDIKAIPPAQNCERLLLRLLEIMTHTKEDTTARLKSLESAVDTMRAALESKNGDDSKPNAEKTSPKRRKPAKTKPKNHSPGRRSYRSSDSGEYKRDTAAVEPTTSSKNTVDADGFTLVSPRRRARRVLRGTNQETGGALRPGVRVIQRDYYIGGLDVATTDAQMKEYLESLGMTCSMCVRLDRPDLSYSAFHVKILKSDLDVMWDPTNWLIFRS